MSTSDKPGIHYVYDGIEEMDNRLPNWWLGILWGSILFAFGYWMYYQVTGSGPDQLAAYKQESAEVARRSAGNKPVSDELLLALAQDPETLKVGKKAFADNCVACHGADGQGIIGPNLTDKYWLHGGKPAAIHKTISEGVVAKGMLAWERTLGAERVRAVTAYVLTLKGKNVAGGKAPQGDAEE